MQISGSIDSDLVEELIKEINECYANEIEQIDIYIDTVGGNTSDSDYLRFVLEQYPGKITYYIGEASSAGFDLILDTKHKVVLSHISRAIIHKCAIVVDSNELRNTDTQAHKVLNQSCAKYDEKRIQRYKLFLTKKELNSYKKGKDVYLNIERLEQIFLN